MSLDLGTLIAHVELDRTHFDNGQRQVENAIRKLESKAPEIPIDANGRPARNEMRTVEREADALDSNRPVVRIEADSSEADRVMDEVGDGAEGLGNNAGQE